MTALIARSEDVWFDAGIKDYSEFLPSECPGTWVEPDFASLAGEEGSRRLLVSTPQATGLSFVADREQNVGSDIVTVRTKVKVSFFESLEAFSTSSPVKGAKVVIGKKDDIEAKGDSAAKCKLTLAGGTAAKALFKFNTIVPGVQPEIEGDYNGRVTVLGSESLGPDVDWIPNNPDAHFYKAILSR